MDINHFIIFKFEEKKGALVSQIITLDCKCGATTKLLVFKGRKKTLRYTARAKAGKKRRNNEIKQSTQEKFAIALRNVDVCHDLMQLNRWFPILYKDSVSESTRNPNTHKSANPNRKKTTKRKKK